MITLKDLKPEATYVNLDRQYMHDLIERAIEKAGSQTKLANILNLHIGKQYQTIFPYWLNHNVLRLDRLYSLHEYLGSVLKTHKIKGLKSRAKGGLVQGTIFPVKLTPKLANVLAKLYCDGCIEKKNSYTATYYNLCYKLISEFKENVSACFGTVPFYERKTHLYWVRIPNIISRTLYEKFRLGRHRVPVQVMNANSQIKGAYLRAVFDDEGSVNKIHGQIRLKMKHKTFLQDIQRLLRDLGVECSGLTRSISGFGHEAWQFGITSRGNFSKFYKSIGFSHPDKLEKLQNRLKSYITPDRK